MIEWIMIVMVFGGPYNLNITVTQVPGFDSETRCELAWKALTNADYAHASSGTNYKHVCVLAKNNQ